MIDLEGYDGFKIYSSRMLDVFEAVYDFARQGRPIIMFGPSGSGKEYMARYYHAQYKKGTHSKGEFLSLNCAGLVRETAHSELFGHVKGSFTDAYRDKPGLFEVAENGVLFLDEIGDLEESVQVMLNRAMDENTQKARRLGSDTPYSTKNTLVICATESGKSNLRDSLLFRTGLQIHVPGLDDRPEDVESAISYFCSKAIDKRLDKVQLLSSLLKRNRSEVDSNTLSDPDLIKITVKIATMLSPLVKSRDWPGNFRALRTAVDSGVIRAKKMESPDTFIDDVKKYFLHHLGDYSISVAGGFIPSRKKVIAGKGSGDKSEIWLDVLNREVPGFKEDEKARLSNFLSEYESIPFKRNIFQEYLALSVRVSQDRIKKLIENNILEKAENQANLYRVNRAYGKPGDRSLTPPKLMELPEPVDPDYLPEKIMEATGIIENSQGLFVSEDDAEKRELFLGTLAARLKESRDVLYFSFRDHPLEDFVALCINHLSTLKMDGWFRQDNPGQLEIADQIIGISGYMNQSFSKHRKTMIILNEMDAFHTSESHAIIEKLIHYWLPVQFILGSKKQFFQQRYANSTEFSELKL